MNQYEKLCITLITSLLFLCAVDAYAHDDATHTVMPMSIDAGHCTKTITSTGTYTIGHCLGLRDEEDVPIKIPTPLEATGLPKCSEGLEVGDAVELQGYPGWTGGTLLYKRVGIVTATADRKVIIAATGYHGESGGAVVSVDRQCVAAIIQSIALSVDHEAFILGITFDED